MATPVQHTPRHIIYNDTAPKARTAPTTTRVICKNKDETVYRRPDMGRFLILHLRLLRLCVVVFDLWNGGRAGPVWVAFVKI